MDKTNNMPLTIGKLATAAEVGVETIRFYERKKLLKQPPKNGGFRFYPEEYIFRIRFLKRSQELGFTLSEARDLLELRLQKQSKCADVFKKTNVKIDEIDAKIRDLKKMKTSLKKLAACCEDEQIPLKDCPLLECFMEV